MCQQENAARPRHTRSYLAAYAARLTRAHLRGVPSIHRQPGIEFMPPLAGYGPDLFCVDARSSWKAVRRQQR
jgi:hypothetical protein